MPHKKGRHVSPTIPSLAAKIADLAASLPTAAPTTAEAQALLDSLRHEYAEFDKFLARRFTRLPETQQQALLTLLQEAQAGEYATLYRQWSNDTALSLAIRARVLTAQERLGSVVDPQYRATLLQAAHTAEQLRGAEPSSLTDTGELQPVWQEAVVNLPFSLALDLARDLSADQPHLALAVLRSLHPIVDTRDCPALVDCLANIPLADSATLLHNLYADTTDKALQKAIRTALHRLKTQGLTVEEVQRRPHTVLVGTVTHHLETCLASHIDGAGDRALWMVRTKPFGGYNVAYLIINYGTGIQIAMGLQASKRELPELLARAQERVRLIELEPIYCQYQVALAHQMNLETHTPVPEEFFALRDIIGEPNTTFERAIIYAVLSAADWQEASAYGDHAADLLALPEFAGWTLPATIVQKYADQLQEIEDSQIIVSPTLQQERINEVYARATEEALGERSRRLMRLRLEEMAYYLWRTERRREALWAVAAAQSLQEENPDRLRRNPFAGALLERSLESAKARPSSRIIQPFAPRSDPGPRSLLV
jgi:hypothetical protein